MNETLNQPKADDELSIAPFAVEIVEQSVELNQLFEQGEIPFAFRTHYVDAENEVYGIGQMIKVILDTFGASNPVADYYKQDDEHPEDHPMRAIVIGNSVFADDVEAMVRATFCAESERYTSQTIRNYLASEKKMPGLGRIQLTGEEDKDRTSPKPRAKYYLPE